MLYIYAARQAYNTLEKGNIDFVTSSLNLADRVTKPKGQASLYKLLTTAYQGLKMEEGIVRDHSDT